MTDYSKMSDLEINIMVSKSLYGELSNWHKGELNEGVVDYCNKAEDAWPIIVEEKISIMFDSTLPEYEGEYHEWCSAISSCQKYGIQYQSNPLRAAMIVYLMMKESDSAQG